MSKDKDEIIMVGYSRHSSNNDISKWFHFIITFMYIIGGGMTLLIGLQLIERYK